MTEREVSEAVRDWALEVMPELRTGYAYPPGLKVGALPDVVALVTQKQRTPDHDEFPYARLQQTWMRIFTVEVSIMVMSDDGAAAHQQLQAFGAAIEEGVAADSTLGGRVEMTSERLTVDYSLPFVEYEDGTRGRALVANLTVGELIPGPV